MKLWIKYIIGAIIGVGLGVILPAGGEGGSPALSFLAELVLRVGRYMLLPLIFFSAIIAFEKLRSAHVLIKTGLVTVLITVGSALVLTFLGFLSVVLVNLPRIPVVAAVKSDPVDLGVLDLIRALFPYSAFQVLDNGSYILPVYLFAMLLGCASATDRVTFKSAIQLSDSVSRLMYNISTFLTEFLPIGVAALMALWVVTITPVMEKGTYIALLLVFLVNFVFVAFVIWPLVLRFLCNDRRPYRVLYASISSLIAAFATGDSNFVLQLNMRHLKESLGVHRRVNTVSSPIFSVFARGGSALTSIISFIVIYHSYSSLAIALKDILWVALIAFLLSFLLGGVPLNSAFISLCVLCRVYGQGFENGFLLLAPFAPVISSFALLFDTLTVMNGSYIVAVKTRYIEHRDTARFI